MSTTNVPEDMQQKSGEGEGIKPLWVGLAICFFFPAGLYLLWQHPVLSRNKTWWWVGGGWSALVLLAAMNGDEDKQPSPEKPVVVQATPKPDVVEASTSPEEEDGVTTDEKEAKEVKSYKVSKGWGRGSVTIELPKDYDIGLDFSDFKYEDYSLHFTAFWHSSRAQKPMRHWEAIDSDGVVLDSGNLFFTSIRSYTPTRGRISLLPDTWKKTTTIRIE